MFKVGDTVKLKSDWREWLFEELCGMLNFGSRHLQGIYEELKKMEGKTLTVNWVEGCTIRLQGYYEYHRMEYFEKVPQGDFEIVVRGLTPNDKARVRYERESILQKKRKMPKGFKAIADMLDLKVVDINSGKKQVITVVKKDGTKGKATQSVEDIPDVYIGFAVAYMTTLFGSKRKYKKFVDWLVKKKKYVAK